MEEYMGRKKRSAEEKAMIALEALKEDRPLREIAEKYGVHPNQISNWKRQLLEGAGDVFRNGKGSCALAHKPRQWPLRYSSGCYVHVMNMKRL